MLKGCKPAVCPAVKFWTNIVVFVSAAKRPPASVTLQTIVFAKSIVLFHAIELIVGHVAFPDNVNPASRKLIRISSIESTADPVPVFFPEKDKGTGSLVDSIDE